MAERTLTPVGMDQVMPAGESTPGERDHVRVRLGSRWRSLQLLPVTIFVILALVGPLVGIAPGTQELANRLQAPALLEGPWQHPLGTDSLGRDILARILEAARLSLVVGLAAAAVSAVVGVLLGLIAGVAGGVVDSVLTGLVELALAVPTIVFGIVLVSTLGQGVDVLVTVLVISGWIGYARVVRLQARSLMRSDFILAAIALGADRRRIALAHLLPNVLPVVVVLFCQQVAAVMIWEASLTYLGIGLPIERVSLGGMIRDGQQHIFDAWWISLFPGMAIALAVIGFNLLADWLQAELDPVRRGRGSPGP